jgi:hypothetical protein
VSTTLSARRLSRKVCEKAPVADVCHAGVETRNEKDRRNDFDVVRVLGIHRFSLKFRVLIAHVCDLQPLDVQALK